MAVRELDSAPSMKVLYPKAVAGMSRAAVGKLPGLGGGERTLPDTELVLADAGIDRERLTAYDRVCGFPLRDEVPATYLHLLAFPLQMELMTGRDFPFGVIGMVHVGNWIEQLRPIRADERLTIRVRAEDLRPHDRGTQFDLVGEAAAGDEPVWRTRNTYLHRESGGGSSKDGKGSDGEREQQAEPPRPQAVWKVRGDVGRRYAEVSGDRNPIHLHPLTARLFGMPGMIAHGMWLKARCLAALDAVLPERFEVDVKFKLPVRIPGEVSFASWQAGGGREFSLRDKRQEKPHLSGTLSG